MPDSVPLLQPPPTSGIFTTFPASKLLPAGTSEQQRFHGRSHVMAEMQARLPWHLFLLPCQRPCLTCHSLFPGQALPFQHQQPLKVPLPSLLPTLQNRNLVGNHKSMIHFPSSSTALKKLRKFFTEQERFLLGTGLGVEFASKPFFFPENFI